MGIEVDPKLLELAFTHRSFAYESGGLPTNERLEFLGDSVLGLVVTEELYQKFPDLAESKLSPLRSGVVNMKALAEIARSLELGQYLRIGKGEETTHGREKNSILSDSLEALVGAIYLQFGYQPTAKIVASWFTQQIDLVQTQGTIVDPKTSLQELSSKLGLGKLDYEITQSGPDHDKDFVAKALINGKMYEPGYGKSKREAEQEAAKLALKELEKLNP